jgi:uncharacterized protein
MESDEKMFVDSPCIGVCELEKATDVCAGCHRTIPEITRWARMTESEKQEVLTKIQERREARREKA